MIKSLLLAVAVGLVFPYGAVADPIEITTQAKAAKADFLLRVAPPGPIATICLVDTGVNVNADTAGVIARMAITGEVSDQSPTLHGTQMAMFMGAQSNGFGMVGLWPSARTVSVRGNEAGQDTYTAVPYIKAVQRCSEAAPTHGIKVVAMPYASDVALTPFEAEFLADEVKGAREAGLSFVAAAGNNSGLPVGPLGKVPGVLSVGASNAISGDRCGFSAIGALLTAPGCALDGADPASGAQITTQQGTSYAAVIAAAALAALRTWRPDLTPDQADSLLLDTASPSPPGRSLDLAAAFRAAGFGDIAPPPPDPSPAPTPTPTSTPQAKQRLPQPRISTRSSGRGARRTLTVKASNRPRGARTTVRVYVRGRGGKLRRIASRTRVSAIVKIPVRSWRRVTVRFSDPAGMFLDSPARVVTRR